jgi:hypothetical protein
MNAQAGYMPILSIGRAQTRYAMRAYMAPGEHVSRPPEGHYIERHVPLAPNAEGAISVEITSPMTGTESMRRSMGCSILVCVQNK